MKKRILAFLLTFLILSGSCVQAADYGQLLLDRGIISGDENGLRPYDVVLRSEFAKMLCNAFGFEMESEAVFGDVNKSDWHYKYIAALYERALLKGDEKGNMNPDDYITRAEMAAILGRITGRSMMSVPFADKDKIPDWATLYVSKLYQLKIITGNDDNTFLPENNLTREECFIIFSRIIEKNFSGGDGSRDNPYIITEGYQFHNIKNNPFASYRLGKDIDFTDVDIEPVKAFYGNLDGNGYKIINPSTNINADYALFEKIMNGAEVRNLTLVCPENYFSVTLENYGRIYGCANISFNNENGQYQFSNYKGAIASKNFGRIENCYNTSLVVKKPTDISAGAICGYNEGEVIGCINYNRNTSVIIGENRGKSENCRNSSETPVFANENYTDFAGGDGSFSNPYKIVTPLHFENIRKFPDANYKLMNSLDFSYLFKSGFEPIEMFSGTFDGNDYKITGIIQSKEFGGIFKTNSGEIKNLTVDDCDIKAEKSASIAIYNNGSIVNCMNGADTDGIIASGIAVFNNGKIENCANTGKLYGFNVCAGICAYNSGEIINCINTASLEGEGSASKICGIASGGTVENSMAYGDMYFISSIGTVYPISDGTYENSYFYNRYESKDEGGLNFKEIISVEKLAGFDFENVFEMSNYGFPVLKGMDFSGVNFPVSYANGDGSKENPFIIRNVNDLYNMRMYSEGYFVLACDLTYIAYDAQPSLLNNAGKGFRPMESFKGVLDGKGYTIYNLNILCSNEENVGFIRINDGTVKNLTLSDSRIEGKRNTGAVCGRNSGEIINVISRASRIGSVNDNSGGICGINEETGKIQGCVNISDVFSSVSAGGICGINNGHISGCTNMGGAVTNSVSTNGSAGGISAINNSLIEQCANNSKVYIYSDVGFAACGGITGINGGRVLNCYNTGEQIGKTTYVCYVGGITGYSNSSQMTNCYNIGYSSATSENAKLGSIVGGGISAKMSGCYYDATLTSPSGDYTLKANGCTALSTEEMTDFSSYKGFNFKNIWTEDGNEDYNFPQLKKNPHISRSNNDNIRDFAGGCGTFENPYRIMTPHQLDNVRKYPGSTFILLNDIDMNQYCKTYGFEPIGDSLFGFYGTFMGEGHTISNLNVTSKNAGGLFNVNYGEIYNLNVENISFASDISGGIACVNAGLIYCSSVTFDSEHQGKDLMIGGIAATNKSGGMIISCGVNGQMYLSASNIYFGGITYNNMGVIAGSFNNAELFVQKAVTATAGGIVSSNSGTVSDCINYCNIYIVPEADSTAGGICAVSTGDIVNSICTANSILARQRGGICAYFNSGKIYNCYFRNELENATANGETEGVYRLSDEELCTKAKYNELDFDSMWYMEDGMYPLLLEAFIYNM